MCIILRDSTLSENIRRVRILIFYRSDPLYLGAALLRGMYVAVCGGNGNITDVTITSTATAVTVAVTVACSDI